MNLQLWRRLALSSVLLASAALPTLAQDRTFTPVTDEMLQKPADGDWLMFRRTLNHWGYSPLEQINKENVAGLTSVWSRAMEAGNQEATPLVYDGVMYLPHPNGVVQALDATNGDLIWEYRRQLPADLRDFVLISDITRALAIHGENIIYVTPDGYLAAIKATDGTLAWETQINDYKLGNLQSSGPIIANGKAISGRSCTPRGGPDSCALVAHDLANGEEVWRTLTIPRPGEEGDDSWAGVPYESRWHVGSWITPSYDPELNMVYFGTSVTSPYSKFLYGTDDLDAEFLYQTSTLAIDADTGEIKWYQQHIRDHWDLDHPFERILVDTAIAPDASEVKWISDKVEPGKEYKVLTGIPGKTGIFYSIDRATGEFLWARETVHQTAVLDIDTTNGRATMNLDLAPKQAGDTVDICPGSNGGKDWMAGSYSPLTNSIYYPLLNMCMDFSVFDEEPAVDGALGQGDTSKKKLAPGTDQLGTIYNVSVETGKTLWKYEQRAATLSVVATGGGLLFGGDVNRRFRAFDQETGEVLWETVLGGSVGGFPISYAVDGRQYIAVSTGGFLIQGGLIRLTPELKPGTGSNYIHVFALPEAATRAAR